MTKVYVLQHVYEKSGHKNIKLIGVYSTRDAVSEAMAEISKHPGFRDYPDGFFIEDFELDKNYWPENLWSILD